MSLPSDAGGTHRKEIEAGLQESIGADPDQGKDRGPDLGNTGVIITDGGLGKDGLIRNRRRANPQRSIRGGPDLLAPDQDLQSKKKTRGRNQKFKRKLKKESKLSRK